MTLDDEYGNSNDNDNDYNGLCSIRSGFRRLDPRLAYTITTTAKVSLL